MATDLQIAAKKVDINISYGYPINASFWTLTDSDGNPFVFTNWSALKMLVYDFDGRGNTELFTTTNLTKASPSPDDLAWTEAWSAINLTRGAYFYIVEGSTTDNTENPTKLFEGTLTID